MSWKSEPNKRALAIVRRSSKAQEENTSGDTQDREIRRYASAHRLEIIKLESIIETAFKPGARRKYNELMDFALREGIKHVIFFLSSREARNYSDAERNERLCRDDKLIIHHVSDSRVFCKDTADSDWLSRDIQTAMNKNYSRENSTRVKRACLERLEAGHWPYRWTALGYLHEKDKDKLGNPIKGTSRIIVDPDIAVVRLVQREFGLRAEGQSYDRIREIVISENLVPAEMKKSYNRSSIEKRMKNQFYWGRMHYHGDLEDAKEVYEGLHPLIIDKEILSRVEAVNNGNRRKNRKIKRPSDDGGFFRGMIVCGHTECQRLVTYERREKVYKSKPEEPTIYHLYRCGNSRKVHRKTSYINEDNIWTAIDSAVSGFAITEDFAEEISKALNETHLAQQRAIKKQMEGFREAMENVRQQRRNTTSLFTSGKLSDRDFNDQISMLEENERGYEIQIEKLTLLINDEAMISVQRIFELSKHAKTVGRDMDKAKLLETFKYAYLNATLTELGNESGLQLEIKLHPVFERLTRWNTMRGTGNWRRGRDSNLGTTVPEFAHPILTPSPNCDR